MHPEFMRTLGVYPTEYLPSANMYRPRMDPPRGMRPNASNNCSLDIPALESGCNSLKLSTLGSSTMG